MDFSFRSFPGAVPVSSASPDAARLLVEDCARTMTAREKGEGGLSPGETFFIRADAEPRCGLEALAKSIFELHTSDATYDPKTSGAEVIDAEDDIGFHWDQDYGVAECGVNVHPHLGTVTYLSSVGGPTIILDHASPVAHGSDFSAQPTRCWVSRPSLGKHICFDGRLLHGAPSDLHPAYLEALQAEQADGARVRRVTFLVNVWLNYVPVTAEPLSGAVASALRCPVKSDVCHVAARVTPQPYPCVRVVAPKDAEGAQRGGGDTQSCVSGGGGGGGGSSSSGSSSTTTTKSSSYCSAEGFRCEVAGTDDAAAESSTYTRTWTFESDGRRGTISLRFPVSSVAAPLAARGDFAGGDDPHSSSHCAGSSSSGAKAGIRVGDAGPGTTHCTRENGKAEHAGSAREHDLLQHFFGRQQSTRDSAFGPMCASSCGAAGPLRHATPDATDALEITIDGPGLLWVDAGPFGEVDEESSSSDETSDSSGHADEDGAWVCVDKDTAAETDSGAKRSLLSSRQVAALGKKKARTVSD